MNKSEFSTENHKYHEFYEKFTPIYDRSEF